MTEIAIYGAGGFGREVNLIIQQLIKKGHPFHFRGYFDDVDQSESLKDYYLGDVEALNRWKDKLAIVIACGDGKIRRSIREKITNNNVIYPSLISPHAILNDVTELGEGSIICAGANLTTNLTINRFTIINLNVTVGHDVVIEDYASVMPGVNLAGNVHLGEASFIGAGASILNGLEIGENSVVGAGGVLTSSLPANKLAMGIPAKIVEK